jgi:hypothetical protein
MRRFTISPNGIRQKVAFPVLAKGNVSQAKRLAHLVRSRGHYARVIPTAKGHSVHVYPNRRTFNKLGQRPDPIPTQENKAPPIPMGKKWAGRNPVARSDPLGANVGERVPDPNTIQGATVDEYYERFEDDQDDYYGESPLSMMEQYIGATSGTPGSKELQSLAWGEWVPPPQLLTYVDYKALLNETEGERQNRAWEFELEVEELLRNRPEGDSSIRRAEQGLLSQAINMSGGDFTNTFGSEFLVDQNVVIPVETAYLIKENGDGVQPEEVGLMPIPGEDSIRRPLPYGTRVLGWRFPRELREKLPALWNTLANGGHTEFAPEALYMSKIGGGISAYDTYIAPKQYGGEVSVGMKDYIDNTEYDYGDVQTYDLVNSFAQGVGDFSGVDSKAVLTTVELGVFSPSGDMIGIYPISTLEDETMMSEEPKYARWSLLLDSDEWLSHGINGLWYKGEQIYKGNRFDMMTFEGRDPEEAQIYGFNPLTAYLSEFDYSLDIALGKTKGIEAIDKSSANAILEMYESGYLDMGVDWARSHLNELKQVAGR